MDDDGHWVGYVHVKDALALGDDRADEPLADDVIRPLATVRRDDPVRDVLSRMQKVESHLAVVTDEDGEVVGTAMLEDVVELMIGEVRDAGQETRR
ncbi:CBS domain-containing protein [Mariniluteicoccus flavus]